MDLTPEQTSALAVAHRLADMGLPIFSAYPDSSKPGAFLLPRGWQHTQAGEASHNWIKRWKPGMCLGAVMGVVFDGLDTDPQNGGTATRAALAELGIHPVVYGIVGTPSTGTHEYIGRTHLGKGVPGPGLDLQAGDDKGEGRGFLYLPPTVRPAKFGPQLGQPVAYEWQVEPVRAPEPEEDGMDHGLHALVEYVVAAKPDARRIAARRTDKFETDSDDLFEAAADTWTPRGADSAVEDQLARVRSATPGTINSTLGGAARLIGRLVGSGYLDEDEAADTLLEAIGDNASHSDGWNLAHGLKWTAAGVISDALEKGKDDPITVAEPVAVPAPVQAAETASDPFPPLRIQNAATMAYWLQTDLGRDRLAGFFGRSGQIVHTPRVGEIGYVPAREGQDNGPAQIRTVTPDQLAAKIQYSFSCFRTVKAKNKDEEDRDEPAMFPVSAAKTAVSAPEAMMALRPLAGVTMTPMARKDGSILNEPGYDPATKYLYLPAPGVDVPEVAGVPTDGDVAAARSLLLDMVADFPFVSDEDRANYLGMLITPLLRELAPPSYKMLGINAHQPGSGKTLLASIMGKVHGWVFRSETPQDDAEWSKATTALLSTTSAPVVVFDNVSGVQRSSVLAGLLTSSGEQQDRVLGTNNQTVTTVNDRVWVMTGNNLSLGGDLVRRTILVSIDPDMANPESRTQFKIQNLDLWVDEHRNEILHAMLTLVRAWMCKGQPTPFRKQSDSFARWESAVGGILAVAGIPGTFDQESGKRAAGGGDDDGLATMLDKLWERFGPTPWTVSMALTPEGGEFVLDREWLPTPVLDKLARSEGAAKKTMGYWLRNRMGRWVTTDAGRALVIRLDGKTDGSARWRIETR